MCCAHHTETCQWAKVSAIFSPTPRKLHKAVVFDDSIYIVGGIDSSGKPLNDVWFYESGTSHSCLRPSFFRLRSFLLTPSLTLDGLVAFTQRPPYGSR